MEQDAKISKAQESTESRIVFFRKATSVDYIKDPEDWMGHQPVFVVKVIELSERQYSYFSKHLLEDTPFIAANTDLTGYNMESQRTKYLLVTTAGRKDAIAVDSEGYDCARYAAYIPDKEKLPLVNVPVERYADPPKRNRQRRHDAR